MDSMREIRNRIVSVQKTMKITNAMYLMASAKMKKARKMLTASEPYFTKLQDTITDILLHSQTASSSYFEANTKLPPEKRRRAYVVVTSDRGLAGAYNHNVIKLTESELMKWSGSELLFVGSAGHNYFVKRPQLATVNEEYSFSAVSPTLHRARGIAEYLVGEYRSKNLNEIYIVFTKMRNSLVADTEIIRLLPMSPDMFPPKDTEAKNDKTESDYEELYDPSPKIVLHQIVPNYVKGLIYGALIEAYASEQNARMIAMDNATKNGRELVGRLSLLYNQVRQSAITTELSEVISGADAQES